MERLNPHAAARNVSPNVRQFRRGDRPHQHHLRVRSIAQCRHSAAAGPKKAHSSREKLPPHRQKGHDPQQRHARHRSRPRNLRGPRGRHVDYLRACPRPAPRPTLFPLLILFASRPRRRSPCHLCPPKFPAIPCRANPPFYRPELLRQPMYPLNSVNPLAHAPDIQVERTPYAN
jgi:hypothetical protein